MKKKNILIIYFILLVGNVAVSQDNYGDMEEIDNEWENRTFNEIKEIKGKNFILTAEYVVEGDNYIKSFKVKNGDKIYFENKEIYSLQEKMEGFGDFYNVYFSQEKISYKQVPNFFLNMIINKFYYEEKNEAELQKIKNKISEYAREYDSYVLYAGAFSPGSYIYYEELDSFINVFSP